MDLIRRNRIAQWVYDTRAVLGRFHLWLEDVEERWSRDGDPEDRAFTGTSLERALLMTVAVTALGTRRFGSYGAGRDKGKGELNRVKKDADAISAYAMSEGLWYLTRALPENHALMISLGEGLMPKAGETPEMGSNPQLGFGRVYARPQVAQFVDRLVHRLLNDHGYRWADFWRDVNRAGVTIWGAAVDTLENTSRFAKGADTGPMAVLHVFDQPLNVSLPYEGYMGTLVLPASVRHAAAEESILIDYLTPRDKVLAAIRKAYPDVTPDRVHVWTLGGESRAKRIGSLWKTWQRLGVHVVEDGWTLPTGSPAFTESGTYAPTFNVGPYSTEDGKQHVFIVDGYAASAEAMQAASLDPMLDVFTSMVLFSPRFEVSFDSEGDIMRLVPGEPDFATRLGSILGRDVDPDAANIYRDIITHAMEANLPVGERTITVDDFFPNKKWRGLALSANMLPDPYSGTPGVTQLDANTYQVTARATTRQGTHEATFTLRSMDPEEETRRVFLPLLDRFVAGEDFRDRAVKISDSGRIRNELQTLCSEALEFVGDRGIRIHFDRIDATVLSTDKQLCIREVLEWYKEQHPIWFRWLDIR